MPLFAAKVEFPRGCVDCHTGTKDTPAALSVRLKEWTTRVDPALLAKAQAAAPKGMTLKGKHPNVAAMVKEIPASCLKCHAKDSKMAPPFAAMMHTIHDTACTNCHKVDAKSGQVTVPSAAEK